MAQAGDRSSDDLARPGPQQRSAVAITAILCATVLLFGLLIWPGQWHYSHLQEVPMRTHRLSGRTELFAGGEWIDVSRSTRADNRGDSTATVAFTPLFHDVQGRGAVGITGYFEGSLYNGTPCHVERAVLLITTVVSRDTARRSFSHTMSLPSRQTASVTFKADGLDQSRRFVGWGIDSLTFRCPKGLSPDKDLFADIVNRPPAP